MGVPPVRFQIFPPKVTVCVFQVPFQLNLPSGEQAGWGGTGVCSVCLSRVFRVDEEPRASGA